MFRTIPVHPNVTLLVKGLRDVFCSSEKIIMKQGLVYLAVSLSELCLSQEFKSEAQQNGLEC